jgi:hypothetical protein
VSLNHTLQISLYYSTHKVFSSVPDFQLSTEITRFHHHLPTANSRIQFSVATINWRDSLNSISQLNSKSKSKLLYDWRFTANQFILASGPLRPTTRDIFQMNSCGNGPYVTSSLTGRWVYLFPAACDPRYISSGRPQRKTPPSLNNNSIVGRCRGNMFTEQLPSNWRFLWLHYSCF